ncbi:glycine betaine ABC transporter substrate-binding protein [Amnibacterium sp.]|uniref:glycine betaine ABC transporter substrate-binding protein n=1 Tax=Amnibacterium sp. TaxID=1872496 RepID=UPI003F7BBF3B
MARLLRIAAASAVTAAAAAALTGCGLQPASSYVPAAAPAAITAHHPKPGPPVVVTSKQFTEQLILGKMGVLAAKAAGYPVTDLTNVPGSVPVRRLMVSGGANMTWTYTGTAWLTYLGHRRGIPNPQQQYRAVRDADRANGLTWLPVSRENNTYAIAVRKSFAKRTGISKLSQITDVPPDQRTFCLDSEFNSRSDGFTPMLRHYGIPRDSRAGVPRGSVHIFDIGAIYAATAKGNQCNFGEVFATDGRIASLGLVVLKDDKRFFPSYNLSPVLSTDLLKTYPGLRAVYEKVAAKLTNDVMIELNRQVDVDGREPANVAFDWMVREGLISRP